MSTVEQNGEKGKRPHWNYIRKPGQPTGASIQDVLEMTESVRNAIEQVRDSQMLQCDVARAIKDIATQIRGLRRDLKQSKRKVKK